MNLKNFSCGFFDRSLNFSVANLDTGEADSEGCVVDTVINYLERGYPTRPTHHLEDLIKEVQPDFSWSSFRDADPINLKPFAPNWNDTIKGSDQTDIFPAKTFFNDLIDAYIPEYSFIKNLIIPEIQFGEFLTSQPQNAKFGEEWTVDFFLPAANLVIEIDGSQHLDKIQNGLDSYRDNILKNNFCIKTHRIETNRIHQNSDSMIAYFKSLRTLLDQNHEIQKIKSALEVSPFNAATLFWDLIAIARFERLLAELLRHHVGMGNKTLKIEMKQDFTSLLDWVSLAVKDFSTTVELLNYHQNRALILPKIDIMPVQEFSSDPCSVKLDFSIFTHFDDTDLSPDIIYVKNSLIDRIFIQNKKQPETRPKIYKVRNNEHFKFDAAKRSLRKNLQKLNYNTFGISDFRPGQFEIISSSLSNDAVLGLMPTGGGKSLCFQSTGAYESGCCLVVCPITALVRDHVAELNSFGFNQTADFISREIVDGARCFVQEKFDTGQLKFLFVSPEKFQQDDFRKSFRHAFNRGLVSRVVIDEVHCISEWGHEFRTAYLTLAQTIRFLAPGLSILCLTATAAVKVIEDIKIEFEISEDCILYFMDQSRKELSFEIIATDNKDAELKEIIKNSYQSGKLNEFGAFVVFGQTVDSNPFRQGIDNIYSDLKNTFKDQKIAFFAGKTPKNWKNDYPSYFTNIGIDYKDDHSFGRYKQEVQKLFKENTVDGIVATKAFGMGVNKPNIRLAVHYGMPTSMEALYQEAGRAGRDQKPAECITLFSKEQKLDPKVHDRETTLEELTKISSNISKQKGDFGQQLYFITANNKTILQELEECLLMLKNWREQSKSGTVFLNEGSDNNNSQRAREKIIFRLKQLGFVRDWTVEFRDKFTAYKIEWKDQDVYFLSNSILKTISKYSGEQADLEIQLDKIRAAQSLEAEECERELIRILLEWNYDHFVYQRRQSLKTLYEACTEFKDKDSFKHNLENYFRTNKVFSTLPNLLDLRAMEAVPKVSDLLLTRNGNLRTKSQLKSLSTSTLRFLESYQNNIALNLLSGLLRAIQSDFQNPDGRIRFESFLSQLGTFPEAQNTLFDLVGLIKKFGSDIKRPLYLCLLEYFPEPDLAKLILDDTENEKAEYIILTDVNKRLEALI